MARRASAFLIWAMLLAAIAVPLLQTAASPLLAWRDTVYIVAGFAGVAGLALLLVQPLLAAGVLPGLALRRSRSVHRICGMLLVVSVVVHVGGLWITSPPDVVDALLLRSPTPFSVWGVLAMWLVFAAAVLAVFKRRWSPRRWRQAHTVVVALVVVGTVMHAMLIEGAMQTVSKTVLCALALAATLWAARKLRIFAAPGPRQK